jgi:hypothetical protein
MVQWRHPAMGCCELGNEPSKSVEDQEFVLQLMDSELLSLLLQAETVFTFNQPNHWTEESPKSSTKLY